MPVIASTSLPTAFSSQIDLNFILINRIFVLVVTLIFFTIVFLYRRSRSQEIHPRIIAPVKLSILGFVLLYAEFAMSGMPSYQALLESAQMVVVLLCLAKLANYLIIDIYLRIHTRREVPTFVRDTVRLVVYLAVGIISLRLVFKIDLTAIVTTSAVITATLAFAMQSTLANALSGFSIQTDSMLARNNWISIKEKHIFGEIINVGFRYTTLRALDNSQLLVPNSVIMQNIVTYHGNRELDDRPALQMDVMLGYDMPPEMAKTLLLQVVSEESEVIQTPEPVVQLTTLNDSGITYQIKFWIADPSGKIRVQDAIYSRVWYSVNRAGYSFPFPHRQIITSEAKLPFEFSRSNIAETLRTSELFSLLDNETISSLAGHVPVSVFGRGEIIVNQGDGGSSLFLVIRGNLEVSVDGVAVGNIHDGSFFGEMSLLTGEPRSATVRASNEVWLAEVTKVLMAPILASNPSVMEKISSILVEREERTRTSQTKTEDKLSPLCKEDYLHRLKFFFKL